MWYSFPFRFSFVQSMPHSGSDSRLWDPASVCFHAQIASSTKCTSKLAHLRPLSISVIMADWMNQMANAVDEAEAAKARAQEDVPTEPAITPRSVPHDVPGSPRWVEELQLPSLEYGPRAGYFLPDSAAQFDADILNLGALYLEEESLEMVSPPSPSSTMLSELLGIWKKICNMLKLQNMKLRNGVSKNGEVQLV